MNENTKLLLDRALEHVLAPHLDDSEPIPEDFYAGEPIPAWDCPSFPRIAEALRTGFTAEEEEWATRSADFRKAVLAAWLASGVSFWMLARYLVEGDDFPFASAMREYLSQSGLGRVALRARFTRDLEAVLAKTARAGESWIRLRDRVLAWEANTRRFLAEFPAPSGVFAPIDADPFAHREEFGDGLTVRLEEVVTSELHVAVSRPADAAAPSALHVNLMGETGVARPAEVVLQTSGEYSGGRAEAGEFNDLRDTLGKRCLVVISAEPPPNLTE